MTNIALPYRFDGGGRTLQSDDDRHIRDLIEQTLFTSPGVPPERNLKGVSFAVANMTGFAAHLCEDLADRSYESVSAAVFRAATSGTGRNC